MTGSRAMLELGAAPVASPLAGADRFRAAGGVRLR
jgi:hypothetical protein